ncbi:hypothetical protein KAT36_00850 [Candidatus Pacearchaeota archaeon]|nr:hypothetical protein [Candidatus Pacearchaeota archaeon]
MNPNIIAGLINRKYDSFDMFSFENRLKLQKFTYILQSMFDLNIGYEFNWYHYGPYSIQLTKDGFNVDFESLDKIKFEDESMENKFNNFLNFINGKENFWLEVVASIHYLKKLNCSEDEIIRIIKEKHTDFSDKETQIKEILEELKSGEYLDV